MITSLFPPNKSGGVYIPKLEWYPETISWNAKWRALKTFPGNYIWRVASASQTDYDSELVNAFNYIVTTVGIGEKFVFGDNIKLLYNTPYNIHMVTITYTTAGIYAVKFNGDIIAIKDCYSASIVYDVQHNFTFIPKADGLGDITIECIGKNPSATAYNMYLSEMTITKV